MNLQSIIKEASISAVKHVNEVINDDFFINKMFYGYTLQQQLDDDRVKDPKQSTQNLTKKIEPLLNAAMRMVIETNGYGKSFETTGLDYFLGNPPQPVEFKATGSPIPNQLATGGRSSAVTGCKTDLTWIIKYTFNNNRIESIWVGLIDLGKCEKSKWVAGNKDNHGFSGLKLHASDVDAVISVVGSHDTLTATGRKGGKYVRVVQQGVGDL